MARKQRLLVPPRLISAGGDLKKKWCVEYSMRNPRTGTMQRFRNYTVFTGLNTVGERFAAAEKLISELNDQIKSGWSPFDNQPVAQVDYNDEIEYEAVAVNYGRQRKSNRNIRIYLSDFLKLKKAQVNTKSYRTYQSKIRSFCAYLETKNLIDIDIQAISKDMIISFLLHKADSDKLAKISIQKYKQILYTFFEFLRAAGTINVNPVSSIPAVGTVKDCAPYPIPSRQRHILAEAIKTTDRQLWLACCFMYYSALRPGEEIRKLRVGDIAFDSRKIIVKSDTAKCNRTDAVDMPDQLYDELIYQRIDICHPDDYVFGQFGRPGKVCLGANTMRNRFNRIRDNLNLSKTYKFYSWKHTGAESLADHGASTWEIQAHLRHRSIETTERYARKRLGRRNDKFKKDFPDM